MKALVGSYSGSEVSLQLPQAPSRPCARAVNLSPPTGLAGGGGDLLLRLSCWEVLCMLSSHLGPLPSP